jgi:tetratricopeptide (TPR) repeat protein
MTDSSNPDRADSRNEVDISRWTLPRVPGGWIGLLLLLIVACSLYLIFLPSTHPNKPARPFDWSVALFSVIPIAVIVLLVWIINRFMWRWLRLAQRPWQQLQRGNLTAAERAYDKALVYANSYPFNRYRRGVMLRELGIYLLGTGRHTETRALLREAVAILEKHSPQMAFDYFLALNNLAIHYINARDYETAQQALERAIDLSPLLKKSNIKSPDLDLLLRLNLAFLLIKLKLLDDAAARLDEAEKLIGTESRRSRKAIQVHYLSQRCQLNLALGRPDDIEKDLAHTPDLQSAGLLWAKANVHLFRGEFAQAEGVLRTEMESWKKSGTPHRPDALQTSLDLAEALFGQPKHDEAFATLHEARSIVADFALLPDAAWKKSLETWLQRARELGKADIAASLEAELQKMPATVNHGITILEKFRIHPQAAE